MTLTSDEPVRAWVDGVEAARISVLDRGLQYGDGIFETITCVDGRPRFLDRHLARLERGCERLGLPRTPLATLRQELEEAAAASERGLLKLLVTRGPAVARGYRTSGAERGSRVLLCYAWPDEPPTHAADGVRVRLGTLRYGENPALAGLKHLNRLEQVLARREWTDSGIFESLHLAGSGCLASGTMCNVFLGIGDELLTPAVELCGVAGVMREVVLEAAGRARLALHVGRLSRDQLLRADELFLTNVRVGVVPVAQLGERRLAPGPLTRRVQDLVRDAR